jgi:TolA-binding protein
MLVSCPVSWGQDKPAIELPEVVIVGQEEAGSLDDEKRPLAPRTLPLGLQSEIATGKVPHLAPPQIGDLAGPVAENPGCLLFSGAVGSKDETLYRRGLRAYNNSDDQRARELFAQVIREYPRSPYVGAAAFWWGESFYRRNQLSEALVQYERVITEAKREPLRDYALYRAAEIRLLKQNYAQAANYIATLRAQYPASPTVEYAHYLESEVAFRQGRFDDAVRECGSFLQRYPQSVLFEPAALVCAEGQYQLGRYTQAQQTYRALLSRRPPPALDREARYGLAWTSLNLGQISQARELFKQLQGLANESRYAEALQYIDFATALQQNELRLAKRRLQELQEAFPKGQLLTSAWGELAWHQFSAGDYEEAITWYRQVARSKAAAPATRDVAQYMMGESLYQLARYDEAASAFRQLRQEAEAQLREKARFRLGLALYRQGDDGQASQVLKAFVQDYGASAYRNDALFWLAEAQFNQQNYREALEVSQRIPTNSPVYDYVLYGRGWSHLRLEAWPQALEAFEDVVTSYPKSAIRADAMFRMAEIYRLLGDDDREQRAYADYLKAYPDGAQAAEAQLQLALPDGQSQGAAQSMEALKQIQAQFPGTPAAADAQFRLGTTLFQQNRFAEAREVFESFVKTNPKHPQVAAARLRIADTYYNEKQFQASLIAYRKVLLLYPNSPLKADAHYGVVSSHYQLEEYPQFLREANSFILENPSHLLSESLVLQMAEYYQKERRLQEAIDTYLYMVQQYADRPLADKARFRLGELYLATGQSEDAIAAFVQVIEKGEDDSLKPDALFGRAKAYTAMTSWKEAAASYNQIAKAYPDSPLAATGLFQAGWIWQQQKDYQRARQQFEAVVERYPQALIRYDAWLQLGRAHVSLNDPEAALRAFTEASKSPDKELAAQAVWYSGQAHSAAGDLQKGINAYLRVAYLYPEAKDLVPKALREAARNYVALNKCPEALKVYEKFQQQDVTAEQRQSLAQELARGGCQS